VIHQLLVYGSYGYTGRLIITLAETYGLQPILAGRNEKALRLQSQAHALPYRVFPLSDPQTLDEGLRDVHTVLHCAGPFSVTSKPMADACLRNRVQYLDITGEIEVIEALAARDLEAMAGQVMLMPGTGFDVVPTDCLALFLKEQLPSATHLMLAIRGTGPLSHGTASTMLEHRSRGGMIRREGKLQRVPTAWRSRTIDFGDGKRRSAMTIPWGDVASAFRTTGIPNIEVYAAVPPAVIFAARTSRYVQPLLASSFAKNFLQRRIDARPAGPDQHELHYGKSFIWGRVEDAAGRFVEGRIEGPNGYMLTAHVALMIATRVLKGDHSPGFLTPAAQFGSGLIRQAPRIKFEAPTATR
jgi:short subunit dehydrogenase-like uncharacterized protein